MSEERIKILLERADEAAGRPAFGYVSHAGIRRRVLRRRLLRVTIPAAAAAVALVGLALWAICMQTKGPPLEPQRLASLEGQVRQLQAQTDATLRLVREVLERDRRERHLASLEAELTRIPDPMQEVERQVDKTAFLLVYQADRLYKELNQTESATRAYKEVIQLFPDNQWADIARERLSEIEQRQINKSDQPNRKGEARCGLRSV